MRKEISQRYYKVFTYQDVDRVPDMEFGYWPQTTRRWLKEGMPLEMTPKETEDMWSPKVERYFGLEQPVSHGMWLRTGMNPPFEVKVLEQKEHSTIVRDANGCTAERFLHDQDESSIPHFIKFPVETPRDWQELKERYRLDDPIRVLPDSFFDEVRKAVAAGTMIHVSVTGMYGILRDWMGFENLSCAFYEYPEMIHDMTEHWSQLYAQLIDAMPADIPVDCAFWWEDMASKNGPFVSPQMFRDFLQPGYHKIMSAAKKRGCVLGIVDCDGNPHDIVGNWLEEGVNIMFPLEVAAGVDPFAWRKEFGKDLRMRGAIAKVPLSRGKAEIDKEIERVKPLLDLGGVIPHLDHLVPPDISFDNYRYYLDAKRKMIGK
jgi:uroporphyrinogen decarboxylase